MKLGKKDPVYDKRTIQLADYRVDDPIIPKHNDLAETNKVHSWGMLGNDSVGDCVFAGAAHEHIRWNAISGKTLTFNDQVVLGDYSAVTGYTPSDPNTDQGTDILTALKYRVNTGIADASGQRHKLGAFVQLEPGNLDELKHSIYLFDAVAIGIQFPQSAMDQFNAGRGWSVVSGSTIEGGHYIPGVAYSTRGVKIVTWGRLITATYSFIHTYCDEVYGLLSPESLVSGKSPEGYDWPGLLDALNKVKA